MDRKEEYTVPQDATNPFEGISTYAGTETPVDASASGSEASEASEAVKETSAKKPASRSTGVARNGSLVKDLPDSKPMPVFPDGYSVQDQYMPDDQSDFTDLSDLNRAINRARKGSFQVKNELARARRNETIREEEYRRAYNRALIGTSGGSADMRKAVSEIATEDKYSDLLVARHVVKELTSLSYALSNDLQTLKTLSDNLRKQMSIL